MRTLTALAVVAFPLSAAAERTVGLEEAYRIASRQNLDLEAARASHEQADALVQQAWGLLKPSVTGEATYTFRDEETRVVFGPEERVITPRDSLGASLTVRQPLFNGQSFLLLANAQDNREAAGLNAENARQQIVLTTARAYWSVVTARRVLSVNEELKTVAEANLRAAQARRDAGTGLGIDVTRAEIDVRIAERQIAGARAALDDSKEALGLVLGLEGPVDAADPEIAAPGSAPQARPTGERPDVRAAALQERIADRAVSAAWWALGPTVDAAFILQWTDSAGAFGRETQWFIVATLTVPFYDGGIRYGVIRAREAEHAQARARSEALSRRARNELRSASRAVETQRVSVQTAERQVELARQALAQSQAAYEAGASTNLEVIQAQQAVRDAEVALVLGRAEWQIAMVRLLVAVGQAPGSES